MFTPYFMLAVCLLHTVITALAVPAPLSKRFTGVQIISARSGLCIAANPGRYGLNDGVPVVSIPCDRAPLRWNINYGSGSVTLIEGGGNRWALDAGFSPGNNGLLGCSAYASGVDILPGSLPADVSFDPAPLAPFPPCPLPPPPRRREAARWTPVSAWAFRLTCDF